MRVISRDALGAPDAAAVAARLQRSARLWERYLAAGGSLAPEYDPTDPLHETHLAEGIYQKTAIPSELVREDVDFESLIEATRACDSPEAAWHVIAQFRRELNADCNERTT